MQKTSQLICNANLLTSLYMNISLYEYIIGLKWVK